MDDRAKESSEMAGKEKEVPRTESDKIAPNPLRPHSSVLDRMP